MQVGGLLRCECAAKGNEINGLPGVSMTLTKWLVSTQNNGVFDPFFRGHGDSRYQKDP